ncbi:uncharacterized protein PG986_013522 [Apiospora aurea]|uniref:Uncharacterized protein n=1 Tax=Apiospora aurea TaxID=335848 RepID=A0ABR1PWU7_9PEZI
MGSPRTDKIILYTNHTCTWANRADVVLAELRVPFEERIINVDGPRPPDFLKINPRALVPVLIWNDKIIIDSSWTCILRTCAHPPTTAEGALRRASMSFFTDAYWSKFHTTLFRLFESPTAADEEQVVEEAVQGLLREVEPLLGDAAPFFGKSQRLTLAEVITGPFVIRAVTLSKHGVYPTSLNRQIEDKAPNFHKWAIAVSNHPSITAVFDEQVHVARSRAKRDRMRKAAGLAQ